jgi:Aminoglycoside-2''-adenylyltransferase
MGVDDLPQALNGFAGPWWVAGGWAVDLAVGASTRSHDDLDVAVLRRDAPELVELLGARSVGPHQLRADGFDLLLNDAADGEWIFRRDARVRRPLDEIGVERGGLPVLAPEVVLLFKAKDPAPKDEADREQLLPRVDAAGRDWLRTALETAYPGHPWLGALS